MFLMSSDVYSRTHVYHAGMVNLVGWSGGWSNNRSLEDLEKYLLPCAVPRAYEIKLRPQKTVRVFNTDIIMS